VMMSLRLSTSRNHGASPYTPVVEGRRPVIRAVREGLQSGD
jgi:hypothetical protein